MGTRNGIVVTLRQKELEETPVDEARNELLAKPAAYQVAVSGHDLTALGRNLDDVKEHYYLMSKTTKEKLAPANVVFHREKGAVLATAIIFNFAKTTTSGAPTIARTEKGVVFFAQAGGTPVKVQFDLSKMTDKYGPDY